MDLVRLISILDQIVLVGHEDVLTLSFRCPARMVRYQKALADTIARANEIGTMPAHLDTCERAYRVLTRYTEEVTAFYQGLS